MATLVFSQTDFSSILRKNWQDKYAFRRRVFGSLQGKIHSAVDAHKKGQSKGLFQNIIPRLPKNRMSLKRNHRGEDVAMKMINTEAVKTTDKCKCLSFGRGGTFRKFRRGEGEEGAGAGS